MMFVRNPLRLVEIFFKTFIQYGGEYWETGIGSSLGWLDINAPRALILLLIILIPALFFKEQEEANSLSVKEKIYWICIAIFTIGFVLMGLLLSWTPLESEYILGCQGRYFVPILLSFFILFYNESVSIKNGTKGHLLKAIIGIELIIPLIVYWLL